MATASPKTTLQQRLTRTYRIPNGAKYHRPQAGAFSGSIYGQIVSAAVEGRDWCAEATGADMLLSIVLAQRELQRIQEAIDSMTRIMDEQDAECDAVAHLCQLSQAIQGGQA